MKDREAELVQNRVEVCAVDGVHCLSWWICTGSLRCWLDETACRAKALLQAGLLSTWSENGLIILLF